MTNLNIAVIGAGRSGLAAAKYGIQEGCTVTVYEKNEAVGGTWQYTEKTGKDEHGLDIHTAMYKKLRTNAPTQVFSYSDFPFPEGTKSFASHTEILKYLESYSDHFDLKRLIKFNHNVIRVTSIENERWEIVAKDMVNDTFETRIYDAVFVANGHFSVPNFPEIPGASEFKGKMIHSHDFRDAERYRGDRVLIIGGGLSGKDIFYLCTNIAERITWSRRNILNISKTVLENREDLTPSNASLQGEVKRFTLTGAEFSDGSHETFSVVIFATGYLYKFPFLSADCGIFVEDNYVQPLYKHIINIEHPTMAFLGLSLTHDKGLEIKFAMKFISGAKKLPSKREMLEDNQKQYQILWNKGVPKKRMHNLSPDGTYFDYLNQLSDAVDIEKYPKVLRSILEDYVMMSGRNYKEYRKYNYTITYGKTYTREMYEE